MRNDNRTIAHAADCVSKNQNPASQPRCSALLERIASRAFARDLKLEDDHPCRVKAVFSQDGECLEINLYSLRSLDRARTILRRTAKFAPWNSDFINELVFEGRHYQVGVTLVHGERLRLRIYFRPILRGAGAK